MPLISSIYSLKSLLQLGGNYSHGNTDSERNYREHSALVAYSNLEYVFNTWDTNFSLNKTKPWEAAACKSFMNRASTSS